MRTGAQGGSRKWLSRFTSIARAPHEVHAAQLLGQVGPLGPPAKHCLNPAHGDSAEAVLDLEAHLSFKMASTYRTPHAAHLRVVCGQGLDARDFCQLRRVVGMTALAEKVFYNLQNPTSSIPEAYGSYIKSWKTTTSTSGAPSI